MDGPLFEEIARVLLLLPLGVVLVLLIEAVALTRCCFCCCLSKLCASTLFINVVVSRGFTFGIITKRWPDAFDRWHFDVDT